LGDGEVVFGNAIEKSLHGDLGDEPRHLAAETEMLANPEAQMALGPPLDVVDIRIAEFAPVSIAGPKGERHLVFDPERLPVQFCLAHDSALETLRRSIESQ